jgi:MYXO-CTERM domain-containing protein
MRHVVRKWSGAGLALMLSVHALGTDAFASVPTAAVPEISPGSLSAGVALLAAGILVLRARRRSR